MPEDIVLYLVAAIIALIIALFLQGIRQSKRNEEHFRKLREEIFYQVASENRFLREELEGRLDRLRDSLMQVFESGRESNRKAIGTLSTEMNDALHRFLRHTTEGLDGIRASVDEKLMGIQISNEKKLDEMRMVVNEKLEKTLESRLQKSFETVSVQLESVNRGLGEMKTVAQSVGSLNRILAGNKSRGILGEVQLGQIIEDMLPSQLYDREVSTKVGSSGRVEYAVKLPGAEEGSHVYLPIDSKFPLETYEKLLDCYEVGDPEEIDVARKALFARIKSFAKDIRDKYISPPETTHFAVMFLPTEGLYAEIAREAAFFEALRSDGIIITGPTTFSAMLNSLQLGFKTLQIQRGAADIEKTLGAVKREFGKFEDVLKKAHQKINQAGAELENLVGTRTNAINRSLRDVQIYTGEENVLGIDDNLHGEY
ncbi:MAG: DNA recombination protein RmuC [Clostridiales bacterium]|jgi:DNA recombination protein RmuC|nr:DNA recombination protein RmuC [Clostridiales bacterium]